MSVRYLVTREITCPTCKGESKGLKADFCPACKCRGVVREDVEFKAAWIDMVLSDREVDRQIALKSSARSADTGA